MTPEARSRLNTGFKSCCDVGDVFPTRFRIVEDGSKYGTETYEYWRNDAWNEVPADIIQRKPTPDGRPILFLRRVTAEPLCFIIDKEGI